MKKLVAILVVFTMLFVALCGCTATPDAATPIDSTAAQTESTVAKTEATDAPTEAAAKHITFRVTHDDGELKEFELETSRTTLAEVLIDEDLVKESAESAGFYDTVDGEVADWNVDEGWWCFYCNGEELMVGIEETELVDGAAYEAVFTHGFG